MKPGRAGFSKTCPPSGSFKKSKILAQRKVFMNSIVVMGSSRSNGETFQMVQELIRHTQSPVIDLRQKNISYFDYEHQNLNDDFIPTMQELVKYESIIFATPVYWFSMAAILKTFIDRFSDLLHERKDLGHLLKDKNMFVMSNSSTAIPSRHFETPFIDTADYLSMNYKGIVHGHFLDGRMPDDVKEDIKRFAERILAEN
jgi:multimeric flavodoxin WrbA